MLSVSIKNASKRYPIFSSRGAFVRNLLFSKNWTASGLKQHALSGINLEIPRGQCVGFIGRNGSGKSTLLKLVAGIVTPTNGVVTINGRISTVLDVASGLHPRLTGYQNIFFKGAIHGLRKHQVERRLERIIDFSGLGEYIDYPISTYSSGMMIRLGFSIAMHMDFDILLLDEILAVGDMVFQRQCLAKIKAFLDENKTILLATHNLGDVSAICHRVVLLKNGRIQYDGDTESVLREYWTICEREQNQIPRHLHPMNPENVYGIDTRDIQITDVRVLNANGESCNRFCTGDYMAVSIRFKSKIPIMDPLFRVQFFRNEGLLIHGANTARVGFKAGRICGEGRIVLEYDQLNLLGGEYYLSVGIWPDEYRSLMTDIAYDCHQWAYVVTIKSRREHGGGIVPNHFRWRLAENNGMKIRNQSTNSTS